MTWNLFRKKKKRRNKKEIKKFISVRKYLQSHDPLFTAVRVCLFVCLFVRCFFLIFFFFFSFCFVWDRTKKLSVVYCPFCLFFAHAYRLLYAIFCAVTSRNNYVILSLHACAASRLFYLVLLKTKKHFISLLVFYQCCDRMTFIFLLYRWTFYLYTLMRFFLRLFIILLTEIRFSELARNITVLNWI